MFGLGAFGEGPFGDSPSPPVVIIVNGALQAGDAVLAGVAAADVAGGGALQAQAAIIAGYVIASVNELNGVLQADAATITAIVRRNMLGAFSLSGEASVEFVSTTKFIDWVESTDTNKRPTFSVEIHLRSL